MCFAFKHKDSHILLLLEDLHRIQSRFRDLEDFARRIFTCVVPELHLATPQTLESLNQACKTWFPHPIPAVCPSSQLCHMLFFRPKIMQIFLPNKKTHRNSVLWWNPFSSHPTWKPQNNTFRHRLQQWKENQALSLISLTSQGTRMLESCTWCW